MFWTNIIRLGLLTVLVKSVRKLIESYHWRSSTYYSIVLNHCICQRYLKLWQSNSELIIIQLSTKGSIGVHTACVFATWVCVVLLRNVNATALLWIFRPLCSFLVSKHCTNLKHYWLIVVLVKQWQLSCKFWPHEMHTKMVLETCNQMLTRSIQMILTEHF